MTFLEKILKQNSNLGFGRGFSFAYPVIFIHLKQKNTKYNDRYIWYFNILEARG